MIVFVAFVLVFWGPIEVLPRARASSGVAWGGRQLRMGVDGAPRAGCDKMAWRHAASAIKTTRCKVEPIECIYADHMAEDTRTLAS